jgi:hypothetical protein
MKVLNLASSALAAFLMVFFAHELLTAPNPIAQAWGVVAVCVCAFAMVYMARN